MLQNVERPVIAFAVAMVVVLTLTTVTNLMQLRRLTDRVNGLVQGVAADLIAHKELNAENEAAISKRIDELEKYIFTDIEPELAAAAEQRRPITPTEAWVRQRDAEFRKRLTALEQWRLAHSKP